MYLPQRQGYMAYKGLIMVPRSRNTRGLRIRYVLTDPRCRGHAAARAVIGPLTTSFPAIRFVCQKAKTKHVTFAFIAITLITRW